MYLVVARQRITNKRVISRFYSSLNNNKQDKDKKDKEKPVKKLSFMPVINIPETEFAHNAFFSLHRPLLGLSDTDEKPFFSNRPPLTEDEKLDEMLSSYMVNLQPFTKPLPPGNEPTMKEHEETYNYQDTNEIEISMNITEDIIPPESNLPIFHMPESDQIIDFLSSIENKLVKQDSKLKKLEIMQNTKSQYKPRFYNTNRDIHQRLRRYQLKWLLKK